MFLRKKFIGVFYVAEEMSHHFRSDDEKIWTLINFYLINLMSFNLINLMGEFLGFELRKIKKNKNLK